MLIFLIYSFALINWSFDLSTIFIINLIIVTLGVNICYLMRISLSLFAVLVYCGNPSSCRIGIALRSGLLKPISNCHSFRNSWLNEMLTQTDSQFKLAVSIKAILMMSFHLSCYSQYSPIPLPVSTQVQYWQLNSSNGLKSTLIPLLVKGQFLQ